MKNLISYIRSGDFSRAIRELTELEKTCGDTHYTKYEILDGINPRYDRKMKLLIHADMIRVNCCRERIIRLKRELQDLNRKKG